MLRDTIGLIADDRSIEGLYIGYKEQDCSWYPIALFTWDGTDYCVQVTKIGFEILAKCPGLWWSLPKECETQGIYRGKRLPTMIHKRMPWGRNDQKQAFLFFDLEPERLDGFTFLSRSGGLTSVDPLDIAPKIKPDLNNLYTIHFSPSILLEASELTRQISVGTTLEHQREKNGSISILKDGIVIAYCHSYFSHLDFTNLNLEVVKNLDKQNLSWRILVKAKITGENLYGGDRFKLWNQMKYSP